MKRSPCVLSTSYWPAAAIKFEPIRMEQVSSLPECPPWPEAPPAEEGSDTITALPAAPGVATRSRSKPLWREWAETLLATLLIFLFVESFIVQGFKVYGSCMEPNLY